MARYEYECPNCGTFEVTQKMTDAPLERHECGAPVEKKISMTGFSLKGDGWSSDSYGCTPNGCAKPGCASKRDN